MLGGCVRRAIVAGLAVGLIVGAWLFRDRIRDAWRDVRGSSETELQPSPELAASAERKLQSLREGSSVALSALELESLLQYSYAGALPGFLAAPRIALEEDNIRLRARLPVDKLPRVDAIADVVAFLPDTTDIAITAKLLPLDSGRVAFGIDDVSAANIPLPRRIVAPMLERLGRRDEPGLPRDALAVRLPPGIVAAYVRHDSLYLLAGSKRTPK